MKAITKLYLSKEELTKIETMIDDIDDFLAEMSNLDCYCNQAYNYLIDAQDNLEAFRDEIDGLDDKE